MGCADLPAWIGKASYVFDGAALLACALSISLLWLARYLMIYERDSNRAGDALRSFLKFLKDIAGMAAAAVAVAAIVILGLAAVTFSFAAHHRLYNPFDQEFGFIECLLFYVEQACKGAFFDVMEVFKLDVQDHLRVDAWRHVGFGCLLVAFRSMMSLFVIGTIFTVGQSYFYLLRIQKKGRAT